MSKKVNAALVGIVATATLTNTVVGNLNIKNDENEVLLNASTKLPIEVQVGTPVRIKTGNVLNGNYDGYVPTNRVASENNNVTNGVNLAYSVPISIHSTNGKIFNIPDVEVTANPVITYNGPQTPEKEKIAKEIAKQIKVQIEKQSNLNSSYSGKLTVGINIGPVDWDMTIQPNIQVKCGNVVQDVNVAPLKTTVQYKRNVSATTTKPDDNGAFGVGLNVTPESNNDYIYNASKAPAKSITFKASISGENGKLVLNPAYAGKGVTYDAKTGLYTVSGEYANNKKIMSNLFNIEPINPSEIVNVAVRIQPVSAEFSGAGSDVPNLVVTNYSSTKFNYVHVPKVNDGGVSPQVATTVQNITTAVIQGGSSIPEITSTSSVGDLPVTDNWNLFGASYVPNGQIVMKAGPGFTASNLNSSYVHLDEADMNIMNNGTPKEKLALLTEIAQSNGNGDGFEKVNAQDLLFAGAQMPAGGANMIIYPLDGASSGGNKGTVSYPALPNPGNPNNTVLGKTVTFGYTEGTAVQNIFPGMNPKTDYLQPAGDGKISGMIAGDDNSITTKSVNDGSTWGFYHGNGQASSARTGLVSNNSASVSMPVSVGTKVTIDNKQWGSSDSSWLDKTHDIWGSIVGPTIGNQGTFDGTSKLVFDMGTKDFTIAGPIKVGDTVIPMKDVKVDGTKIIITPPAGTAVPGSYDGTRVPVRFTDLQTNKINVTFGVEGPKSNPTGIVYSINNKNVTLGDLCGKAPAQSSAEESISFKTQNGCMHYSNGVQSNNTSTMTALVQNASKQTKQYLTIIQLPKADNNSLPGNQGQPSQGGLSATLQSINNADCPIYVLPKSAVNDAATPGGIKTNEQQINSTNPFDMAGMKANIESGKTGWVKYTPGMDLSNIASIAAMPTIKGNSIWKLNYNVKLDGVQNGTYQYTTSEFKYYDVTDGVGSISNVVTLAPKGANLNEMWNSSAVVEENGSTRALTKEELAKTVTFTNSITGKEQTEPLSYIFSHGNLVDANYDITPATPEDHLQQNVDLVNSQAALAKIGFKLVKTTVKVGDGGAAEVNKDFFTNTGVISNTQFTKVVFVLEPITPKVQDSVIVQVKGKDGTYANVVKGEEAYVPAKGDNPGTQAQQGKEGTPLTGSSDVKTPSIPAGYKIDSVIVKTQNSDGSWISNTMGPDFKVPTTLGKSNTQYIYQISKVPVKPVHDTVSVTVDGKTVPNTDPGYVAPQTGKDGVPVTGDSGVTTPKIPKDYYITGVKVITHNADGTTTTTDEPATFKVPAKLGKTNTDYIYNITKMVKDTLQVNVKQADGTYKQVEKGQGGYVAPQTGEAGIPEQGASGISNPTIPTHYKIDSIYLNGKKVASTPEEIANLTKSIPTKLGKEDENYVYNISPIYGSVTTQVVVVGEDGKTILPKDAATQEQKTVQGQDGKTFEGTPFDAKAIDTITINGTQIDLSSKDASSQLQKLGYKLVKTTLATPSSPTATTTSMSTINGSKIENGESHVVYTLQKLPMYGGVTVQVKNLTTGKDEVAEHEVQRAKVGTTLSDAVKYTAPKGYSIVKTTLNNTDITQSDLVKKTITEDKLNPYVNNASTTTEQMKGDQHVVYTIVKNVKDTVKVLVDGKPMTTEVANESSNPKSMQDQNGLEGTPAIDGATPGNSGITTPVVPTGYKITSITLNGKPLLDANGKPVTDLANYKVPEKLAKEDQNFVYNITKIVPVTVKVITADGTPITATTTNNVKVGSKDFTNVQNGISTDKIIDKDTGINVPKGYHITKLTVNGKEIKPVNNVWNVPANSVIGEKGTQVVYTLTKDAPKTWKTTVTVTTKDGGEVPGVTIPSTIITTEGGTVTGTSTTVKIPKGYKIVKVTEGTTTTNGTEVTPITSVSGGVTTAYTPDITKVNSDHHIHYVVEKIGSLSVQVIVDGDSLDKNNVAAHDVEAGVAVGTDLSGYKITVPKGYKLVKTTIQAPTDAKPIDVTDVTVNKDGLTSSLDIANKDIVQGTTKIVYHLERLKGDVTTTVVGPNGKTFKTNPPISGDGNDGDVVPSDKTTITPPPHYHVVTVEVNGKKLTPKDNGNGTYSVPPMDYNDGHQTVVYHVAPDQGNVDVTVKEFGTNKVVIPTAQTVKDKDIVDANDNLVKLSGYQLTDADKAELKKEGYELVPVNSTTVQVNNEKVADTTQTALAGMDLAQGTTHITYYVQQIGTASVKIMLKDGDKVTLYKDKGIVDTDKVGSHIKDYDYVVPKGYHLVSTTVKTPSDKDAKPTTQAELGKMNIVKGNTEIVYTIEKDAPKTGKVTVEVLLKDGDKTSVYKETKVVQNSDVNTPFNGDANYDKQGIPAGYHLVKTTVNKVDKSVDGKPATSISGNIVEGTTAVVYTIEKDAPKIGTVDVTVNIVDAKDNKKVLSTPISNKQVQSAVEGTAISGADYNNVKTPELNGYHIVSATVNGAGTDLKLGNGLNSVTGKVGDGVTHVVYNIVKDAPKTGKVTVEVLLKDGDKTSVYKETKVVQNSDVNTPFNGDANYDKQGIPAGYHLVKTTVNKVDKSVDGKPATSISGNVVEGTTAVVYTIEKDAPKTGTVNVTVNEVDAKGTVINVLLNNKQVQDANVGTAISGANYDNVKSVVPAGYHLASSSIKTPETGSATLDNNGVVTGKVVSGITEVIYNVVKDTPVAPKTGTVDVTVETQDGTVMVPTKTSKPGVVGTPILAGDTAYTNVPGYDVVGLKVNGKEVPKTSDGFKVPPMTFTDGTQHVVWIVEKHVAPKPVVKTGTVNVTVNIVDAKGTVIKTVQDAKEVQKGDVGTAISGANYSNVSSDITKGYHLVSASVEGGQGTNVTKNGVVTGNIYDGATTVVYNITKDAPKPPTKSGSVKVTVVTTSGDVLVKNHTVKTDKPGTKVTEGIGYTNIPGYTLVKTSVDGTEKGAVSVSEVTLTDGTTQIIYTVEKNPTPPVKPEIQNGSVKVTVVTTDGKIIVPNHTVSTGETGTEVTSGLGYNKVDGYHLVKTTIDGTDKGAVSVNKVTLTNGTTQIIYTIEKDPTPPTPVTPPVQKTGKVTVTVVDTNGNVVVKTHTVTEGIVGGDVTGTGYTPSNGYEISKITIDGKVVSKVPSMKITNGTTSIVYVIDKKPEVPVTPSKPDVKPEVKYGNVTVQVVTEAGKVVVQEHEVAKGIVGTDISSTVTSYEIPAGYHLVKETVGGKEVSTNPNITLINGTTKVVYVIAKNPEVPVKPEVPSTPNTPNIETPKVPEINTPKIPVANDGENIVVTPNKSTNNNENIVVGSNNTDNVTVIKELPKTGIANEADNVAKGLGIILGVSSLLGFVLRRKK